ncbi:Uncharacterised protein [Serratia odorifera]|uniref:Uncharacterized protein n=2 Tax=Serratia odorifera TaxID=618 RepID=D4EA16_SEROD|nr:hypothetical protein HMPREF0758_5016 [Serratia odorifera DSM 4582]VDZ51089.1 Uncharacterised protein [Serratia odorifera]
MLFQSQGEMLLMIFPPTKNLIEPTETSPKVKKKHYEKTKKI